MKKLAQNPNNCATALSQTDDIFENMIRYSSKSMASLFNAYPIFCMEGNIRQQITKILEENKGNSILALLMSQYEIISIVGTKDIEILPQDIVLIQNLLFSSPSMYQTESWVPICLPGISASGYLQLYCHFIDSKYGNRIDF